MKDLKQFIKTTIREFLNENDTFSNKKTTEIFFRKSRNPQNDIIRNFSCYHNIVVVKCYGESISLGVKSNPEKDSMILTRQITNPF